jgi:serine/threonine protein kinase
VNEKDIENEVRAVKRLCMENSHKNVITVMKHGWLLSSDDSISSLYYIDMELCDENLDRYMKRARDGLGLGQLEIWDIMLQITKGVAFIHGLDEVHRDLKPKNSIFLDIKWLMPQFSFPYEVMAEYGRSQILESQPSEVQLG